MKPISRTTHLSARAWLLVAIALLLTLLPGAQNALASHSAVNLNFNTPVGGIAGTGFTTILAGTNAPSTDRLTLAGGALVVQPTTGDIAAGTAQDNALAISYDSHGSYTIATRLLAPIPFDRAYQSGGIFVGQSNRGFIRLTAGKGSRRSTAERLQIDVNDNGKIRSSTLTLPAGTFRSIDGWLDLFLTVNHTTGRVTALYRIDSNSPADVRLAASRALPRWMRIQGAQTEVPALAGIVTTSRSAPTPQIDVKFDSFGLIESPVEATFSGSKTVDRDGFSGPKVNPGDTLTYTINVSNSGAAATFRVVDPMPADTTYVVGSASGGATFEAASNSVIWQSPLGTGQSASFTFQVKINQAPLQSATIVNQATLANLTTGGLPTILSAQTIVDNAPDLAGSDYTAAPTNVGPGDTLTFTLNVRNDGTVAANGARASLSIPAGTTYIAGSASAPSGSFTINSFVNQIQWTAAAPIAPDTVVPVSFQVQVGSGFANGAAIESQATVQATGTLPNIETAQATVSVSTVLAGSKSVDKTEANAGDALTYTLSVENTGNTPATFQLADPIPADTTYVADSVTSPATYDSAAKTIRWQATLEPGATASVSFQVTINLPPLTSATVRNEATLVNVSAGGIPTLLSATTTVRGTPSLEQSTYTVNPLVVAPDDRMTFSLNLLNSGTVAVSSATVELTVPAGSTLVVGSATASSGSVSFNAATGRLVWTSGGPLPVGAVVQVMFQAQVESGLATGARLTSTAAIRATGAAEVVRTASASFGTATAEPDPTKTIFLPVTFGR
ncbi:MAG: hypothetical protein RLZZ387_1491 [Chloroflexota bacterium]|jgi:uncharacterized repeat protein (TIGR01451 family)